jgi:hypothetical protein
VLLLGSSFPTELILPRLDLEEVLLGGLVGGGEGLVGSFALNCVLGKVLKRGDDGREFLGGGDSEDIFLGFPFEDPLSNALILSAIGMEPTAESLDIVTATRVKSEIHKLARNKLMAGLEPQTQHTIKDKF